MDMAGEMMDMVGEGMDMAGEMRDMIWEMMGMDMVGKGAKGKPNPTWNTWSFKAVSQFLRCFETRKWPLDLVKINTELI